MILESFGVCDDLYNYNWMFSDYEVSIENLDSVVYRDLYITAFDNRPCIELNVDGVSYKAYHTETLTLADAIDLINSVHGTSITFEGYIWSAYSNDYYETRRVTDPYTFIVVEPGYSRTATAKTLQEVEVYFVSDFGPINDEIGIEAVTFKRGDAWWTPEIGAFVIEMAGGYVTFTGGFEYRVEEKFDRWEIVERRDISSTEELFALNLESVTLYAKYEINYGKIRGTYARHGEILVITDSTISVFYRDSAHFSEPKPYKVEISANQLCLTAEDYSFSYSASYLNEYVKIEDGGFCAVIYNESAGYTDMYFDFAECSELIKYYDVISITDKDEVHFDAINECGLYFIRITEKAE